MYNICYIIYITYMFHSIRIKVICVAIRVSNSLNQYGSVLEGNRDRARTRIRAPTEARNNTKPKTLDCYHPKYVKESTLQSLGSIRPRRDGARFPRPEQESGPEKGGRKPEIENSRLQSSQVWRGELHAKFQPHPSSFDANSKIMHL